MIDTVAINESANLVQLVEQAGANPKTSGSEFRCACPIHGGKDVSAFAIYDGGRRWKCFSGDCGSGDAIAFVMAWKGISFIKAVEWLGGGRQITPQELEQIAAERERKAAIELADRQREWEEALSDLRAVRQWITYHENLDKFQMRIEWRKRGIPDEWQEEWQLGCSPSFRYNTPDGPKDSPTITMPIFGPGYEVLQIRHRILFPHNPKDKYRPEVYGLPAQPFMAYPDLGWNTDRIIVWEGEVKSAVLAIALNLPNTQVIGLPGKSYRNAFDHLKGHDVIIGFDPGAEQDALKLAKELGGAMVIHDLPDKVDDLIVRYNLGTDWARGVLKSARKVK